MNLNKALLVFVWFMSNLALLGIFIWAMLYAYYPKHPNWAWWVVPLQETTFVISLVVNIGTIAMMLFPDDWFVSWADKRLQDLKKKD